MHEKNNNKETTKKNQTNSGTEEYNKWTENLIEGFNKETWPSRRTSELEDRPLEITKAEEQK